MKRILLSLLIIMISSSICIATTNNKKSKNIETKPTRKEVITFVKEAVAYAKKHGKEAAIKEFENKEGRFWKGELYIFAYNYKGINIGHGQKPHLRGKNLYNLVDPNGVRLIQELIKAAKNGGGWVEYYWEHPAKKKNWPKAGYAEPVDDEWWLGSGLYLDLEE